MLKFSENGFLGFLTKKHYVSAEPMIDSGVEIMDFFTQGHLLRHSFVVTPSPTGEGLGDVMLSITICNKAKVLAFYQSTAERTA